MIDITGLERRPVDKIFIALGYPCSSCGEWQNVFFTTRSLDEMVAKIEKLSTERGDFPFQFSRALRKATGIQEKAQEKTR